MTSPLVSMTPCRAPKIPLSTPCVLVRVNKDGIPERQRQHTQARMRVGVPCDSRDGLLGCPVSADFAW